MKPKPKSEEPTVDMAEVDRLYAHAEGLRAEMEQASVGSDEYLDARQRWSAAIREVVDAARAAGHPHPGLFPYLHLKAVDDGSDRGNPRRRP